MVELLRMSPKYADVCHLVKGHSISLWQKNPLILEWTIKSIYIGVVYLLNTSLLFSSIVLVLTQRVHMQSGHAGRV